MANQKRAGGADLWFVTAAGSAKLSDLAGDPHVNLSYYRDSNREWAGPCQASPPFLTIARRSASSTSPTGKSGSPRKAMRAMGPPYDPRMVLIGVTVHAAEFLEVNKLRPVLLDQFVRGGSPAPSPRLAKCTRSRNPPAGERRRQHEGRQASWGMTGLCHQLTGVVERASHSGVVEDAPGIDCRRAPAGGTAKDHVSPREGEGAAAAMAGEPTACPRHPRRRTYRGCHN